MDKIELTLYNFSTLDEMIGVAALHKLRGDKMASITETTVATETTVQDSPEAIRPELLQVLDHLSQPKQVELLNFARFLQGQMISDDLKSDHRLMIQTVAADSLVRLTGLIALGGDAIFDTETLYDEA